MSEQPLQYFVGPLKTQIDSGQTIAFIGAWGSKQVTVLKNQGLPSCPRSCCESLVESDPAFLRAAYQPVRDDAR
jgi:hypothetical protein